MDGKELEKALKRRDEAVFAQIIDTHTRLLWTVAGAYLPRAAGCAAEDVEECVSDVFYELWRHPERYDSTRSSLKTYLCTLTKHRAVSLFRKRSRRQAVYLEDIRPEEEPRAEGETPPEDYSELYRAVRALEEPTRQILIRRYFYGEKPAAIARAMDLPAKKVENCLYRGKQALSRQLTREAN